MYSFSCPARDHSPPVCAQGRRRRLKHLVGAELRDAEPGRNAVEDPASSAGLLRRRRRRHRRTPFRRGVSARATGTARPCSWRLRAKRERDRWAMATVSDARTSVTAENTGSVPSRRLTRLNGPAGRGAKSCRVAPGWRVRPPIGALDTRNVFVDFPGFRAFQV